MTARAAVPGGSEGSARRRPPGGGGGGAAAAGGRDRGRAACAASSRPPAPGRPRSWAAWRSSASGSRTRSWRRRRGPRPSGCAGPRSGTSGSGASCRPGDADGLRERLAIAERELGALDGERRRLDTEIRDLEVALREAARTAGSSAGRGRRRARRAPGERRRLELEGRAWRLLAEKLAAADQSMREKLVAPIGQRLRPLLQRVFPGAGAVFDPERLSLTHLRRDGAQEAFDSLSVGAREQLAVLVRLAFASLLAEREGEAPCLILDDALVYADEARFETMKTILQRAAREMQILVLTCRPRDYFGLDARYLRLEDCRLA